LEGREQAGDSGGDLLHRRKATPQRKGGGQGLQKKKRPAPSHDSFRKTITKKGKSPREAGFRIQQNSLEEKKNGAGARAEGKAPASEKGSSSGGTK